MYRVFLYLINEDDNISYIQYYIFVYTNISLSLRSRIKSQVLSLFFVFRRSTRLRQESRDLHISGHAVSFLIVKASEAEASIASCSYDRRFGISG